MPVRTHRRGGSVFQRKDGMWVAVVELYAPVRGKRYRKFWRSTVSREVVQAKLDAYLAEHPVRETADHPHEYHVQAAARKTHSRADLLEKYWAAVECPICHTALNPFNRVRDHIVPVSEGGDDSIENMQYLCWECNLSKSNRRHLVWAGPPRPFRVFPTRAAPYERFLASGLRMEELTLGHLRSFGMRVR